MRNEVLYHPIDIHPHERQIVQIGGPMVSRGHMGFVKVRNSAEH